jgi:histone-lysine N-methyltransferase SETMAR
MTRSTQAILQEFRWEVFEHPAHSPDLTPNDFRLFPTLKEFLSGKRFKSDEEVKDAVHEWLNGGLLRRQTTARQRL